MKPTKAPTPDNLKHFKLMDGKLYRFSKSAREWTEVRLTHKSTRRGSRVYVDQGLTLQYHTIVWVLHGRLLPAGSIIKHLDGNKLNNDISNLKLVVQGEVKEQISHARAMKIMSQTKEHEGPHIINYQGEEIAINSECLFCGKCGMLQPPIPNITDTYFCKLFLKLLFNLIKEPTRCKGCSEAEGIYFNSNFKKTGNSFEVSK